MKYCPACKVGVDEDEKCLDCGAELVDVPAPKKKAPKKKKGK